MWARPAVDEADKLDREQARAVLAPDPATCSAPTAAR